MNPKKLAAATAAVVTYIKTQEEAAQLNDSLEATMDGTAKSMHPGGGMCATTWAITGRSDMMQARSMMQMRIFK